jgi:hypothetical protein
MEYPSGTQVEAKNECDVKFLIATKSSSQPRVVLQPINNDTSYTAAAGVLVSGSLRMHHCCFGLGNSASSNGFAATTSKCALQQTPRSSKIVDLSGGKNLVDVLLFVLGTTLSDRHISG